MRRVAIINPHLPHQMEHGQALAYDGWEISHNPREAVSLRDVVLVSGPHFALKQQFGHPKLLMIDRAWWGDPVNVSISWLKSDGTRQFPDPCGPGRTRSDPAGPTWTHFSQFTDPCGSTRTRAVPLPQLKAWKTREQSALIFLDHQQRDPDAAVYSAAKSRFGTVRIRRHPADAMEMQPSLDSHLALSDVAIGWKTTALVHAAISGVPVICLDPNNIVRPVSAHGVGDTLCRGGRQPWIRQVANAQITMQEIADGFLPALFRTLFRD